MIQPRGSANTEETVWPIVGVLKVEFTSLFGTNGETYFNIYYFHCQLLGLSLCFKVVIVVSDAPNPPM